MTLTDFQQRDQPGAMQQLVNIQVYVLVPVDARFVCSPKAKVMTSLFKLWLIFLYAYSLLIDNELWNTKRKIKLASTVH